MAATERAQRPQRTRIERKSRMGNRPPRAAERLLRRDLFPQSTGKAGRPNRGTIRRSSRGPEASDEEGRARDDGVELPDVLVGAAEEVDGDGLPASFDLQVVFVHRDLQFLGAPEDLVLHLLFALDRAERCLFLHHVVELRRADLDRNDLPEDVADESQYDQPHQAPEVALAPDPASPPHSDPPDGSGNLTVRSCLIEP